jgi:hypothetical protein
LAAGSRAGPPGEEPVLGDRASGLLQQTSKAATFGDRRAFSAAYFHLSLECFMGSSHMPPVPPANRTKKGPGSDPEASKDESVKHPEHHHNAAEEGETANIKQNTTNKGFFRGRRQG